MTKKMIADDRTFEEGRARMLEVKAKAEALEEEERRRAQEDNETEGPGLRRGPEKHRHRSRRLPKGVDGGDDDESKGDHTGPKVGWGGFPLVNDVALSDDPKTRELSGTFVTSSSPTSRRFGEPHLGPENTELFQKRGS